MKKLEKSYNANKFKKTSNVIKDILLERSV